MSNPWMYYTLLRCAEVLCSGDWHRSQHGPCWVGRDLDGGYFRSHGGGWTVITLGIRVPVDFVNFYQIAQSTSSTESYSEGFTLIASILHKIVSNTVSEQDLEVTSRRVNSISLQH